MSPPHAASPLSRPILSPTRVSLIYAGVAATWILASDKVVAWWTHTPAPWNLVQSAKGLLFVGVTAGLLYWWARRFETNQTNQTQALIEAHERSEQARRMYATLSAVNRHMIRPPDTRALQQAICDALIDPGDFRGAWLGRLDGQRGTISPVAHAGLTLPAELRLDTQSGDDPVAVLAEAASSARPAFRGPFSFSGGRLDAAIRACGAQSCVALPFQPERLDPMLFVVYGATPTFFTSDRLGMLQELVADLEHGIDVVAERERRTVAETALRTSEERYRLVAENSQDVIWICSDDGKLQYISPSVRRLLGYSPAEMQHLDLTRIFTPASHQRVQRELDSARKERATTGHMRSRLMELEQIRVDGSTIWTEVHTMEFNDDNGQYRGILGVTRDIAERRAAAQALASEIARCRALLDVSVDGIHVLDVKGRLLDANEVFLQERGFARNMIPSLSVPNWDVEIPPDQIQERLAAITAEPTILETVHRRMDNSVFPVEVRARRVAISGETVIYCTTRDVTERKGLEQRMLRSQRLESVGLIASGIAHDLNNVLTPILLSTGLLEMKYGAPEDRALLEPIEAAARRGSNIVQQILTFARGAEGERVAIEPKLLLKELNSLIRETFPRNIAHRLVIAPDASALVGDPTQLHQVFLNLAVNARDAMPQGGTLTLEVKNRRIDTDDVRAMPSAKPGDYVEISVADTGTGMTPDVLDHLFEPFFTTKPRGRGTGLGLSTVHGLVRGHGGFVDVTSQLGRGSAFHVFLPIATKTEIAEPVAPTKAVSRLGHGELVLIADDEPAIRQVTGSVLQRHGFVALTAADGHEAVSLLDRYSDRIAIVITDVMMPKFDGVRLATEVRRRSPTLPIIAMSGLIAPASGEDTRQQLRDLGVSIVIDKPYGEAELMSAVEQALEAQRSENRPTTAAL